MKHSSSAKLDDK